MRQKRVLAHPSSILDGDGSDPDPPPSQIAPTEKFEILLPEIFRKKTRAARLMASKKSIQVQGTEITFFQHSEHDFISLTDIARQASDEPRFVIRNWLSTQNTINYLGGWESLHNPDFNRAGFRTFRDDFFEKPFSLTPSRWIELTNALGIVSKAGKTGGGTFAHRDIALNFCYWINPIFQIYLIQEFQRLKDEEAQRLQLDWNLRRSLSKINYRIHTDAVKNHLVPARWQNTGREQIFFASEADLLNLAMFGMTAQQWREANPAGRGNLRDNASAEQLLVLANLENLNAEFIKQNLDQPTRLERLNEIAIHQMELLLAMPPISKQLGDDRATAGLPA